MPNSRNVMANMKAYADLKRNSFDISNGHIYSQKCGEIIPIKAVHTMPGDFMRGAISDQNLSFPMNTAAFLRARKEITTYFVPYNHVFSLFNQLQATRPDPKTSALAVVDSTGLEEPRMYLYDLYYQALAQFYWYTIFEYYIPAYVTYCYNDEISENLRSETNLNAAIETVKEKLLDTTQYFSPYSVDISFNFTMYDVLGSDYVRTLTIGHSFHPDVQPFSNSPLPLISRLPTDLTTFDVLDGDVNTPLRSRVYDMEDRFRVYQYIRKLDMLGYGNLYPLFKATENVIIKQLEVLSSQSPEAVVNPYYLTGAFNRILFNILRMTTSNYDDVTSQNEEMYICKAVNLYSILAYNKVFYDYFRNTYYDLKYNSRNYNIDFCVREGSIETTLHPYDLDFRFLDIEYHQWKKDIITGVLPNAQYGAVSGVTIDTNRVDLTGAIPYGVTGDSTGRWRSANNDDLDHVELVLPNLEGSQNGGAFQRITHTHDYSGSLDTQFAKLKLVDAFDVLQLKRAEMLQAYRQMLMRNGNRTIDIFKGLYGDAPASEDDNSPRFVDAFGSTLFVDTVVSTADTSQQNGYKGALGDLGARSVINGGGSFKFKTSDFGCLLFLCYIVPEATYPSLGLDPANRALDPETHFIPFFQNLGFQQVLAQDFNLYFGSQSDEEALRAVGYAPSYYEKKTDIDRAHGNFVSVPSSAFVFGQQVAGQAPWYGDFVGSFNHWVPQRNDVLLSSALTLKHLYINPSFWDNIFVQKVTADFDSDHFVCNTRINLQAVRKLSKLGLPNF